MDDTGKGTGVAGSGTTGTTGRANDEKPWESGTGRTAAPGLDARTGGPSGSATVARVGGARGALTLASVLVVFGLVLAACGAPEGGSSDSGRPGGGAAEGGASGEAASDRTAANETTADEATTEDDSAVRTFSLPGERVFPEGVAYDPASGDFFVGSTQSGTVYRGNVRGGSGEAEVFLEGDEDGRTAVTGMKVDGRGRLFVAGRDTGRAFVYDASSGDLIRALETPGGGSSLINDVTVTREAAYFTDSFRPVIYRVPLTGQEVGEIEPWLDLEGTPIVYRQGFNLNGIAASADGRYLITVHFASGRLYRVDTESGAVTQVDLGGEALTTGDGLVLDGRTLYVVRESPAQVVPVELSEDLTRGDVGEPFSDPSFRFPTTTAKYDDRLLVVNSQLNMAGGGGGPVLPFTVSDVPIPAAANRVRPIGRPSPAATRRLDRERGAGIPCSGTEVALGGRECLYVC